MSRFYWRDWIQQHIYFTLYQAEDQIDGHTEACFASPDNP